jgi:hypothetical protein
MIAAQVYRHLSLSPDWANTQVVPKHQNQGHDPMGEAMGEGQIRRSGVKRTEFTTTHQFNQ